MWKTLLKIVMIVALFTLVMVTCSSRPVPERTIEIDSSPEKVDSSPEKVDTGLPPGYKIQKGDGVERYRVEVRDTYVTVHSFKTRADAHRVAWNLYRHEAEVLGEAILHRETVWKDLD